MLWSAWENFFITMFLKSDCSKQTAAEDNRNFVHQNWNFYKNSLSGFLPEIAN